MTADDMMAVLARRLNIEGLALNEQRMASIYIGEMTINFEEDESSVWLYVHGEVAGYASLLPQERLLGLLKAHHLFNDLPNATLGISRDDALELFMRVQLVDGVTDEDWMAMFVSFAVSLNKWRAKFGAEGGDGSLQAEELHGIEAGLDSAAKDDEEIPFGFSGGIRV
ncbi:MAG: type III secretion system chaperone [Kiritimatiellae bacterium]|nr:type III secretion system chaperone [Kiritimatiellia bacterium]